MFRRVPHFLRFRDFSLPDQAVHFQEEFRHGCVYAADASLGAVMMSILIGFVNNDNRVTL